MIPDYTFPKIIYEPIRYDLKIEDEESDEQKKDPEPQIPWGWEDTANWSWK